MKSLPFRAFVALISSLLLAFGMLGSAQAAPVETTSVTIEANLSLKQAQWNLAFLGLLEYSDIDGKPGPKTTSAVKLFQAARCINANGVVGPATSANLINVVGRVQSKLKGVTADGLAGPATRDALGQWQWDHDMQRTGQMDLLTFDRMDEVFMLNCVRAADEKIEAGRSSIA